MAESKKRGSSSVSVKEKDALEDLDIGKDFFTSWKSISMADADALDFDLTPASKGNKKPFNFDKADMDFNFDDDFGKMSTFNMDMPDLDISPPLKKDGKSKEKSKESSSGKDAGSSFDMDMPDLDISPPLKRGDKTMEKSKDSSNGKLTGSAFNMDMSDLDISMPFKKDGKSKEKSKESSTGKTDRFAFALDFDELDNLGFGSSLIKEDSKAQRDKTTKESSPDRGDCQDKDVSTHMNVVTSMSTLEDGQQKPSLPETRITFDMDCLVGGSVDLEPTRKACYSNSAMDDAVITEHSAAIDEIESEKTEVLPEETIVSRELQDNGQSVELVSHGQVDLETCTGIDAMKELSSDYPSNNEPGGGNSSEAQNKVDSMHTNSTGSNGEQDANVISVVGSTCSTLSKNSQHLQTDVVSENINTENSWDLVEDHVIDGRGKTVLGQINSLVENTCTATAVSGVLHDSQSGRENLESSRILKLSSVIQPAALKEKQTENGRESLVNSSLPSIRAEKPECPLQKVSTRETFSSLSSKKMGFAQPSLVEGRRDRNTSQSDNKLVPLSLQHSKALLRDGLPQIRSQENSKGVKTCGEMGISDGLQNGKNMNVSFETQIRDRNTSQSDNKLVPLSLQHSKALLRDGLPQIRSQENSKGVKTCGEMGISDGLQNGKNMNVSFETQIKDMMITKPATSKRETSMKDLDTLSMDINKKAAKNREKPTTLTSIPTKKNNPLEEHRLSLTEGGKKTPDLPKLKLTGLSLYSTNSPIQKDSKSISNSSQKSTLIRKTPSDIAHFPNTQKQTPSTLPMKRTLEDAAANSIALHPSKRLSLSASSSRNLVETSEKVLNRKVPCHSHMEDDRVVNTVDNSQVMAIHLPHEVNNKGVETSFSIQNDSNIKMADSYSKELDDICNILRKKHNEAKEILAQAIVNSNKLLMLNNHRFQEKIRATQDMFARLTVNSVHG
ncbi:hypothetical protein ACS0TY_024615 [Phlomoides rotata]